MWITILNKMKKTIFQPKSEAQKQVMENIAPNLLFNGPWGSGKTHILAEKAYFMGILYQDNKIALVRKKRVDLKTTLWKWLIDKILPSENVVQKNDTELYRKLVNGTEIQGFGLDSTYDINKLASHEYGFIAVEEAVEITEDDYDTKIIRCLRLPSVPFHQLVLATNPGAPSHFLYKRFYMEKREGYEKIEGNILPDLPESYYRRVNTLTGIYRERYKKGKWVSFEGLVYPFDPAKHIIKGFEIPKDGKIVIAIDFGFDHPFVCQWWYVSTDDKWYCYRQIYHSYRTVKVHSGEIKYYCKKDGIEPVAICDHDAEDMATLRENGIKTVPAIKDRLAGQQIVYGKFDNNQLFFFRDSLVERDQRLMMKNLPIRTEEEFGTYVWKGKGKEDMVKTKDDGMDCMRYAIATFLKIGRKQKSYVYTG
ncbi:hypothetical protein ES705_22000 [subsurface metagenome]